MIRRLLAIESATDWLSVSLHEGDRVVQLREAEGTRQHASALMPLIAETLAEAGWELADLDALAASVGPGSFTSLRIGLATLKGLAFGHDLPAVGVSTLEAMASGALDGARASSGDAVLALLDARRGEAYAGAWQWGGARPSQTLAEGLYAPAELAADLSRRICLVCPEPAAWRADFEAAGLEIGSVVEGPAARPRADRVGVLALAALDRGEGRPAEALSARYLRRAEAEAKRLGGPVEEGELARLAAPSRASARSLADR
jgi:tRNA threonylcarbamoyladenosine biosynthesis protein TsaB